MAVTPSAPISLNMAGLAALVAASATFRTVVGAASAAAALASIHYPELDLRGANPDTRPWALIRPGPDYYRGRMMESRGSLLLSCEFPVDSDYQASEADAFLEFTNNLGQIIEDMLTLANTSAGSTHYLNVVSIEYDAPPGRCDKDDFPEVDFYGCRLLVTWEA